MPTTIEIARTYVNKVAAMLRDTRSRAQRVVNECVAKLAKLQEEEGIDAQEWLNRYASTLTTAAATLRLVKSFQQPVDYICGLPDAGSDEHVCNTAIAVLSAIEIQKEHQLKNVCASPPACRCGCPMTNLTEVWAHKVTLKTLVDDFEWIGTLLQYGNDMRGEWMAKGQ